MDELPIHDAVKVIKDTGLVIVDPKALSRGRVLYNFHEVCQMFGLSTNRAKSKRAILTYINNNAGCKLKMAVRLWRTRLRGYRCISRRRGESPK